ncbi:PREDICTED: proline-rich transmembrane protein 1-like isoform X1 [Acropora digitifera]|uniref:proline-rich transmembrane protein 1-like isoform X1 n=1 Tax=Acropora digitifera TaxID=70779 RepID=UPI00077A7CFF|nr:PREDICTED: proline-rich transmembrane protein 1-like isoform X1 [Acropora digitifera]XP_015761671.1 PREDICTED: proline-rich transmembrane protein 1-like isoform X1 [Acropora digitifera]XP_015761672.1 PREDICTED: proline-rich transmembrane protein 1-like isoform X1 [Acropora digitifera]XP_015761673.1 PREDICTED: proline-rich transmembrane protein 1-like isoform X1 [Acropora digitifera]XP_015761674.1 PREDICTED: proline-rich transmembrane protein 1-like isoform X1 [Acropora digitifera]
MMASPKEDDVATVKDSSSSPPKYTSAGGVASQHPSEFPPSYTEQPSYPMHTTGQAIPASGGDTRGYQTPLNYPQQLFYQGTPGGLVVTGQPGNTMMPLSSQDTTMPEDHSILAWFACLCCFWPVGIIAVLKSTQVQSHLARGDVNSARIASADAKKYARIAVCIGTSLFVLSFVLVTIVLISILSR